MAKIRPVEGKTYIIVRGDTLWDIADTVYGSGWDYTIIWDANKSNLRSNDPNKIYPGERLWIPPNPNRSRTQSDARSVKPALEKLPESLLSVYIDGDFFLPASATITRTFDTCADGWAATFRDNIQDANWLKRRGVFRPYTYPPCEVFLADRSLGESIGYDVQFSRSSNSGSVTMTGASPTADILDSVAEPPYEASNITLWDWTLRLIKPFGLSATTEEANPEVVSEVTEKKIKRVKIGRAEKVFEHLSQKYRQKGFVLSNTIDSNISVRSVRPATGITEEFTDSDRFGGQLSVALEASFSGRDRYRKTIVVGKSPRRNFRDVYVDPAIERNRTELFEVTSSEQGDAATAADARARKRIEDALTFPVSCRDWFSTSGVLYEPGQFVVYKSRQLFLEKGVTLMIRKVEYKLEGGKRSCSLYLIPPSVYSHDEIEDPWNLE